MKAILKYPGSKWRIADEIVKRIPRHHSYLEPFFGSGAVFFNKKPSDIEMINDLDNEIPNLFKCIRDDPEKLAARVTLTPYSRYEYESAHGGGTSRRVRPGSAIPDKVLARSRFPNYRRKGWMEKRCSRPGEYVCPEELVQSPGRNTESGRTA